MKRYMVSVLSVLFALGLVGTSFAGSMEEMKGKAEGAQKEATESMETKEIEAKEASKEAQEATQKEAGGMMDQLKEGAKGKVDETGKDVNETIDKVGK